MSSKVTQCYWSWCHSIGHVDFLLAFHCINVSILHRFRDIISYFAKTVRGHLTLNTSLLR